MKKEVGLLSVNDNFSLIDVEKWNRREIFFYFSRIAPTTYSVTSNLDITNMIKAFKEHNLKFFPSFLWLSTTIINQHPEFRVAMQDGNIGYYSSLTPFYPAFHSSDKSISMLWTEYSPSLFEFHSAYLEDKKLYGENKVFLGIGGSIPPENAYTISVLPWLSFSSFSLTSSSPNPYFFPSIEGGKFIREDDRVIFPLSFTSHHATTDRYHVAEFYREFQEKSDDFSLFLSTITK